MAAPQTPSAAVMPGATAESPTQLQPPVNTRADIKAEKAYAKASRPWFKKKRFIIPLALVGLVIVGSALSSGTSPTATDSSTSQSSETSSTEPSVEAEPTEETEPTEEAEPPMTRAQENALGAAENYINLTSFSRDGLIKQLKFEGYSKKNATFAVDRLNPDWKDQAAKKAEEYLDLTSFSRSGLIQQLMFDGFTRKQATYGVNQAGL